MPIIDTTDTPAVEDVQGATPEAHADAQNDTLGDKGLKALQEERAARKASDKRVAELEALLQEKNASAKSLDEQNAERIAKLEEQIASEKHEKKLLEASVKTGVPVELLAGASGDVEAYATALADWKSAQSVTGQVDTPTSVSVPTVKQRPEGSGAITIDEQIAVAQEAGDSQLVSVLKAMKLGCK